MIRPLDAFSFLSQRLQYPLHGSQAQADFDRQRMSSVEQALRYRPQFLPVQHTLPAAAASAPIAETTDIINYPVIITGAISDQESRNCRIYRNQSAKSLINYGSESNLKLSMDAIFGHSVATAGFAGVRELDYPLRLDQQEYITLEIYQETSPGSNETVTSCLVGVRCLQPATLVAQLSAAVRSAVERAIKLRPSPEYKYAICQVEFDSDGNALCETPRDPDEPMLILGHRSTFTDASVSMGFSDNFGFSEQPFPIWALCAERNNARNPWQYLPAPLFVEPNRQVRYSLKNTIDTTSGLVATDGNIEVLMRTM
jgi:hypothetical protein